VYYDRAGAALTPAQIAALPSKKLAVGTCTRPLRGVVDLHVDGCMPLPNAPHAAVHTLSGTRCAPLGFRNRHLLPLFLASPGMSQARQRLIRGGARLDLPLTLDDQIIEPRPLSEAEWRLDFIPWDFPPLTPEEIRRLGEEETRAALAMFSPQT